MADTGPTSQRESERTEAISLLRPGRLATADSTPRKKAIRAASRLSGESRLVVHQAAPPGLGEGSGPDHGKQTPHRTAVVTIASTTYPFFPRIDSVRLDRPPGHPQRGPEDRHSGLPPGGRARGRGRGRGRARCHRERRRWLRKFFCHALSIGVGPVVTFRYTWESEPATHVARQWTSRIRSVPTFRSAQLPGTSPMQGSTAIRALGKVDKENKS